jgi:monomeric isocitrate dehydrogenase
LTFREQYEDSLEERCVPALHMKDHDEELVTQLFFLVMLFVYSLQDLFKIAKRLIKLVVGSNNGLGNLLGKLN